MMPQNNANHFNSGKKGTEKEQTEIYGRDYGIQSHATGNDDEVLNLAVTIGILNRYKWLLGSIMLLTVFLSGMLVNSISDQYEATGKILILEDHSRMSGGTDLSNILTSIYGVGATTRINNEIAKLRSRQLSDSIAEKVFEKQLMENGNYFPILFASYPKDTTRIDLSSISHRISRQMEVKRYERDTDILAISYRMPSPFESKELVNLTLDTYTELSATQRRAAANSALTFLETEKEQIEQRLQQSEEALRRYMSQTSLVQIDGQTSAMINRIAELESQLQQVQVQLVAILASIELYESQLERIRPGLAEQISENISGQIERAQFRLADLQIERTLFLQANPSLRQNPDAEPQFVQLENEIHTIREEIRNLTNNLLSADDSDVYIGFLDQDDGGITSRIVELRRNIIELRIQESQLNAQEEALQQRLSNENLFFESLPDNMIELARLHRDAQINEELFWAISRQFQETQLWEQTQYGSGRVIDYAILPLKPVYPNKFLFLLVGFIAGGLLGIGIVVIKETFSQTIEGTSQLKAVGYPILSVIPDIGKTVKTKYKGKDFVKVNGKIISTSWSLLLDNLSPISESYRRIYNNIIFSSPKSSNKVVLITSTKQGEGKSTVSINLAATFAEAGYRVLLIDTDLRRPNSHILTGESIEPGITELFFDKIPVTDAIKKSVIPRLDILTAGRDGYNPVTIVQSEKFASIINKLKPLYDHIVIDTPPYGVITDSAPLIQRVSDVVVVVTRFGDTRENELNHTIEILELIHAKIVGTVITKYNHKKSMDYYYLSRNSYDNYQAYEKYEKAAR